MSDPLADSSGKGVSCVLDRESALGVTAELAGASGRGFLAFAANFRLLRGARKLAFTVSLTHLRVCKVRDW